LGQRSTSTSRPGLQLAACLGASILLVCLGSVAATAQGIALDDGSSARGVIREREQLRDENAALQARLSLSKDVVTYLVADLPLQRLRLELQGVTLTSLPIEEVSLNRHARRLLAGAERVKFLESPFVLGDDRWFELAKTLALKDSSAVRARADTTGTLMQAIRTTPVTAMLTYDRRLTLILEGKPPRTRWQRLREKITTYLQSWSSGTMEGILKRQSSDELMVTLVMSPADVRSLAPTLVEGNKLILIF
jgi:hypothetical protein